MCKILSSIRFKIKKFILKMFQFNKMTIEESFLVSGKGCIFLPLEFSPDFCAVGFVHEHNQCTVYPSCNPIKHDIVTIDLVISDLAYGVEVCWDVNKAREVKWVAQKYTW